MPVEDSFIPIFFFWHFRCGNFGCSISFYYIKSAVSDPYADCIPGMIGNHVDAAITHQRILKSNDPAANDEIQVTVQNRGTTILVNTLVEITTPVGRRRFNATTLAPGAVQTFSMPVRLSGLPKNEPVQVTSTLDFSAMAQDITPQNNQRSEMLFRR